MTTGMAESFADILCAVWEIDLDGRRTVKSYRLIRDNDFPDSLDPSDLDQQPVAVTVFSNIQPMYSMGHKHITWFGKTIFHVSPDLAMSRIPSLMPWYGRILRAAAANVQLDGTVGNFVIVDRPDGITGPRAVSHGGEAQHWGFVVEWMAETTPNDTTLPVSA